MKNYFAIYGKNALAVYDNGRIAQRNFKYVPGGVIEKFEDFDEAVESAKYGYNAIQTEEQRFKAIYPKQTLPLNYMIFRREIEADAFKCERITE